MAKEKCRAASLPSQTRWPRSTARPSGRTALGEEGRGSLVDPQGRDRRGEDPLRAARREFEEELGSPVSGDFIPLTPIRQASGKLVYAWAVEADFDPATLQSGTFSMEWPPRSGRHAGLPRSRSRGVVHDRGGEAQDQQGADRLARSAQFSVGRSMRSTTSTSTGPRRGSSRRPEIVCECGLERWRVGCDQTRPGGGPTSARLPTLRRREDAPRSRTRSASPVSLITGRRNTGDSCRR